MSFTPGETVIWKRQEKGGRRRVVEITVELLHQNPSGTWRVRYQRGQRIIEAVVSANRLEPLQ